MALFGRNKRYNTLYLASKIACQRQASRPSFGNLPAIGNTISVRRTEMLFAGIHFPRVLQKRNCAFLTAPENEKENRDRT